MLLLVPADPLHPREPDSHWVSEADTARELGAQVAVVDHDAVIDGRAEEAVRRVPTDQGGAVYRGWMLRPEQYEALSTALAARGVALYSSPAAYRTAHELPGWYNAFSRHTPFSVWAPGRDRGAVSRLLDQLPPGPAIVKDYVKSMKHYWFEAAFIADTSEREAADRVVGRFLELRAEEFEGGLVFRAYEALGRPEVRTWWLGSECFLVTAHPDEPDALPPSSVPTDSLVAAVEAISCVFITVDIARREDGDWRVVEVGDGQVSDRPTSVSASSLLGPLFSALEARASASA